jgi:Mg2+-importing ATPase
VVEGRRVFGNITKYIRMGSSSNLGNMISFTGASIFLPFLPMTSVQVIFNNFLYDVSQLATPTDAVDQEYIQKPLPWNIGSIQRFMIFIGPVSSIFDFATFGVLLWIQAPLALFHTVWFIESLVTQTLAIHVIRTSKIPFLESMPSAPLLGMSLLIVAVGLFFVLSPIGAAFGFVAPSLQVLLIVAGIVVLYLILLQVAKMLYSKLFGFY